MKVFKIALFAAILSVSFFMVSCETLDQGPKPQSERLSSMPHNMPASWEGQAGMPGMMGGQY